MTKALAIVSLLSLSVAALASLGCRSATGVLLTVDGNASGANQLRLTASWDGHDSVALTPGGAAALQLPTSLFARFDLRAPTSVTLTVEALRDGSPIARTVADPIAVAPGRVAHATVVLGDVGATNGDDAGDTAGDLAAGASLDMAAAMLGDLSAPPDLTPTSAYVAAVLADHPTAYYRLDEPGGTIAFDATGHALHATYGAKVQHATAGLLAAADGAASFGGGAFAQDGIVSTPTAGLFESADVTVELWVRETVANPDDTKLVSYGDSLLDDPSFGIAIFGGRFALYVMTASSSSGTRAQSTTQAQANTTYHVVETYDGQTVRLYVNGALEASTALGGSIAYTSLRGGLGIGASPVGGPMDTLANGTLDEVAIYPAALSAARVHAHYLAGTTP